MKLNKFLLMGAIALGLVACNNNDVPEPPIEEGNTFAYITVALPSGSTRALPDDYNAVTKWAGNDAIENLAVYLVDANYVTKSTYTKDDFTLTQDVNSVGATTTDVILKPKKGIKTTPGYKKVYVVINAPQDILDKLNAISAAGAFETAYKDAVQTIVAKPTAATSAVDPNGTAAGHVAKFDAKDHIMMTNYEECAITVAEGITETQTLDAANPKNRAKVKAERVVGRILVTFDQTATTITDRGVTLGTISDLSFVVAQGERAMYYQRKADWKTPGFNWIPTATSYDVAGGGSAYNYYDYEGLKVDYKKPIKSVATYAAATTATDILKAGLDGIFLLPNTHDATGDGGYRKGNTAYILVRAKFAPSRMADGHSYVAGEDFYVGANGAFYSSFTNARTPANGGVTGQEVARYVGGKVLYVVWANPNVIDPAAWIYSPVIRNNIYHVHIKSFKKLGTNWNPLVPQNPNNPSVYDPSVPGGVKPGDTTNPFNPDPKPGLPNVSGPDTPNPNEPDNPIDPEDPLKDTETWMSVDVTIAPWAVHSYQIEL